MYEFIQNGLVAMPQGNYDLTETTAKDILKPIKNERKKSNYSCDISRVGSTSYIASRITVIRYSLYTHSRLFTVLVP